MRLTYKGDYAIKVVLELSRSYPGQVVTIHDLAAAVDAPEKFLEQVLQDLKRGGFVDSRRGKAGGYILTRPPGKIRLGEVVRFMDGPTEPIACVQDHYQGCRDIHHCVLRGIWRRVDRAISAIVDGVTFEDLVKQAEEQQGTLNYCI